MKANELTIGQKYIWRRNSEVSHEVTYLGTYEMSNCTVYDFEYIGNGETKVTALGEPHIERDITPIFEYLEKYYPNYYNSSEIACLNDLSMFLDKEITYIQLTERQVWIKCLYPWNIEKEYNYQVSKAISKCILTPRN